jgi:hypothetical protein
LAEDLTVFVWALFWRRRRPSDLALGDRTSHYGLTIGPRGHLAFALLDFGIALAMYLPYSRSSKLEKALQTLSIHAALVSTPYATS